MPGFTKPLPLGVDHSVEAFDCGVESLNVWLSEYALTAAATGSARTYAVATATGNRVVGYQALSVASITPDQATARARRGMPGHPIPAVLLARLAVDREFQGCGIGATLLADAMRRALSVAETAGIRLLLVHAIDDTARSFYQRFGFEPSPSDPFNLQLLIKDIRKSLDESGR